MLLALDDDGHGRGTLQAVRLDVPIRIAQHSVACRREAREVGHLPAGNEADGCVPRQIQ
jgi:hypothetical protein